MTAFPTEREVYHRLRWDPRFDLRRCHIVFSLRPSGTRRVAFLEHDLDAVPWHRIVEFWIDDQLAWSRPGRIDRLDELASARGADDEAGQGQGSGPRPGPRPGPRIDALTPHAWRDGAWRPGLAVPRVATGPLRVATWNLLFDRFDAEVLGGEVRWRDALDRLGALALDVVVLVEITPKMWTLILAQPWVQGYTVSHAPGSPHLVPYGQVILSRYPMRDVHRVVLARRPAFAATLELGAAGAIGVVALHLVSDRKPDAALLRAGQLDGVLAHVAATPRAGWIIAGDLNAAPAADAALDQALAAAGAIDGWAATRPDEPGHTFDVASNRLAAVNSISGRSARLDRILAIGLPPVATRLIGVEPGPTGMPPSDHYGVYAELALPAATRGPRGPSVMPSLATAPLTRRVSLAIVPPADAWGAIQRVRCASERGFGRWPPHLTLAHPFVDGTWLDRALPALRQIAAAHPPFDVTLERIAPIEPGSRTIVMTPDRHAARAIERLHAAVRAEVAESGRARYVPHLTIAREIDARTIAPFAVSWRVDRLVVLREEVDEAGVERFVPIHDLPLGDATAAMPAPSPLLSPVLAAAIAQLRDAVQLVEPGATVEPYGSLIYAPMYARDIDLVVETDRPVDVVAGELSALLELEHAGDHLGGRLAGVEVDLSITSRGAPDERMRAGPRDGRALRDHLRDHGRYDAFLAAWPEVRRLVELRALGGNGLGYFGSFGWAMLLAIPLCHDARLCTSREVVADWLAWGARLEPYTRLGFDAPGPIPDAAPLWIAAPSGGPRNVARGITIGTFAVLRDELRRAVRTPLRDLDRDPASGITRLEISGVAASRGIYEGKFRALLDALEAALGPVVRPWGRFVDGTALPFGSADGRGRAPTVDVVAHTRVGEAWQHTVGVPTERAGDARDVISSHLAAFVPEAFLR